MNMCYGDKDTPLMPLPPMQKGIRQMHGVFVLHKPKGPTSTRCIAAIKRLGQKKIGHAGTLDPMASGVLLVLLGHATKIAGYLLSDGEKIYSGTMLLGQITDTWDAEGNIIETRPWEHVQEATVRHAIALWQGTSVQPVPPYSAAKHEGQPLYKLARAGKETPHKVKEIEISHTQTLDVRLPYVRFRVHCGSGTYIRSLAHSLGMRLGCGAVLTELTREYSHPFALDVAHELDALVAAPDKIEEWTLPITRALPHWPVIRLDTKDEALLRNGTPLPLDIATGHTAAASTQSILCARDGTPLALAQKGFVRQTPMWTILRGLWL